MGEGPETRLVKAMRKAIKTEWPASWFFKVYGNPFQKAGVPDLLVVIDGHLVGIEAKAQRPGESRAAAFARTSKRQWAVLMELREAGATAGVALSVEDALTLCRQRPGACLVNPPFDEA